MPGDSIPELEVRFPVHRLLHGLYRTVRPPHLASPVLCGNRRCQAEGCTAHDLCFASGMMFGPVTAGWMSDKFFKAKRFQMICCYFVGCIIVLVIMAFIPIKVMGLPWAIVLQVLAGLFVLGINGALFTAACDFGGRTMAGTAVGTINLFNYFGSGLQGVLIGGILTVTGSWTIVFASIAGFMVIGTILVFVTKE